MASSGFLISKIMWYKGVTPAPIPTPTPTHPYVSTNAVAKWHVYIKAIILQGNSNSISSVDVSAGYVGLEEYNAPLIAVLMVCSTYAGPIFWLISLLKNLAYRCKTTEENTNRYL